MSAAEENFTNVRIILDDTRYCQIEETFGLITRAIRLILKYYLNRTKLCCFWVLDRLNEDQ